MDSDRKIQVVNDLLERIASNGELDLCETILSESFEFHGTTVSVNGREQFKELLRSVRLAWQDFRVDQQTHSITAHTMTSEITISGIHSAPYLGIPATHKPFRVRGQFVFRFRGDRISEMTSNLDTASLLNQLGIQ